MIFPKFNFGPLIFVVLLITSCQSSSIYKLLNQGEAQSESFFKTIPFEYRAGVSVIEVEVNGIKGWFLFDTGAPNVISEEFTEKLELVTLAKGRVSDAGGNRTKGNPYVRFDSVGIGGVSFYNTVAIVQNLRNSDLFKCLELDGIIGANLMRNAYWKIDYPNMEITLTSNIDDLNLNEDYKSIPFKTKNSGTPVLDVRLNKVKLTNIVFDTGSSGHISVPQLALDKLEESNSLSKAYSVGATSFGVGGKARTDTTYFAKVDTIEMGGLLMTNKVVEFEKYSDNMGNEFFQNYDVVLDWEQKEIHMLEHSNYEFEELKTFGFGMIMQDGLLKVGSIYHNTDSEKFMKGGDQIVAMNDYDFRSGDFDQICDLVKKERFKALEGDSLNIRILRGDEELSFRLNKTLLIE